MDMEKVKLEQRVQTLQFQNQKLSAQLEVRSCRGLPRACGCMGGTPLSLGPLGQAAAVGNALSARGGLNLRLSLH